jgi:hypothetical protein
MKSTYLLVLFSIAILPCVLYAESSPENGEWSFDTTMDPFLYSISIDHQEIGKKKERIQIALTVRMQLRSIDKDQNGVWSISVQSVSIIRKSGTDKFKYDSRKTRSKKVVHPIEIRWVADLYKKELELTVSPSGHISKAAGFLKRLPSCGCFIREGAAYHPTLLKSLVSEAILRLFYLPKYFEKKRSEYPRIFCHGAVLQVSDQNTAGSHLQTEFILKRPSIIPYKNADYNKKTWFSRIHCGGCTIQMGDFHMKLIRAFPRLYQEAIRFFPLYSRFALRIGEVQEISQN